MMLARRELIVGGAAAMVAASGLVMAASEPAATPDDMLAGLQIDGDVLLLHDGGSDAAPLLRALRDRSGSHRIADKPVSLLDRGGFVAVTALLIRARHVHLLALLPAAQSLVLDSLLARGGVVAQHHSASGSTMLLTARLN